MNVAILGAGPAGLTAAHEILSRTDWPVTIFEESDAVGGISRTVQHGRGRWDIGGHRFHTTHPRVQALWSDLLPHMQRVERKSSILHGGDLYDYPIKFTLGTLRKFGVRNAIEASLGLACARLRPRKEDTLENYFINSFGKPLYERFFRDYTKKLWGYSAANLPATWGRERTRGLSLKQLREGTGTAYSEFLYPRRGAGTMFTRLANKLAGMGCVFKRNTKITERPDFDLVFSSIPLTDLYPDLLLEYRDFILVGLLANGSAMEREQWIYVQDDHIEMGRIQLTHNWSRAMCPERGIACEYFCNEGDRLWESTDDWLIAFARIELRAIGMLGKYDEVYDPVVIRQKKAYPSYACGRAPIEEAHRRAKEDNIHLIGRNGRHVYANMDDAMLSAMEAVDEVLK